MVNAVESDLSRMNFKKLHEIFEHAGHLDLANAADSVDKVAGFDRLTVYELFKIAAAKFAEAQTARLGTNNAAEIAEQLFKEQVKVNPTGTGSMFEDIDNAPNLPNYLVLLFVRAVDSFGAKGHEARDNATNHNMQIAAIAVQADMAAHIIENKLVDEGTEVRERLSTLLAGNISRLTQAALRR